MTCRRSNLAFGAGTSFPAIERCMDRHASGRGSEPLKLASQRSITGLSGPAARPERLRDRRVDFMPGERPALPIKLASARAPRWGRFFLGWRLKMLASSLPDRFHGSPFTACAPIRGTLQSNARFWLWGDERGSQLRRHSHHPLHAPAFSGKERLSSSDVWSCSLSTGHSA
jgi:hypothetical protein